MRSSFESDAALLASETPANFAAFATASAFINVKLPGSFIEKRVLQYVNAIVPGPRVTCVASFIENGPGKAEFVGR